MTARVEAPIAHEQESHSLYESSAFYGMLFSRRTHDLPFYLDLAAGRPRTVLDLGVGRGRLAIPYARAGHQVVGVDNAPAMLDALTDRLREEPLEVAARVQTHLGCARRLILDRRFDLVVCAFNGVAHHHGDEELHAFFGRVREHIAPGGRFAFDALLPTAERLTQERVDVPWLRHPAYGTVCRATETRTYDTTTGLLDIEVSVRFMEEQRSEERHRLSLRLHPPASWGDRLRRAGLRMTSSHDLGDVRAFTAAPA